MAEFDVEWTVPSPLIEFNRQRIVDFLENVELSPEYFKGKLCLDAGCGSGRFTYAMLCLGAEVHSIDISDEGLNLCRTINSHVRKFNLLNLVSTYRYDFVLCWGVLHHLKDPREGFGKVVGQVKRGGQLHVMLYSKDRWAYPDLRKKWRALTRSEQLSWIQKLAKEKPERNAHGWYDYLNPEYDWQYSPHEIETWFEEEGFVNILQTNKKKIWNVNMQGTLP